jgi:hypothetical protein
MDKIAGAMLGTKVQDTSKAMGLDSAFETLDKLTMTDTERAAHEKKQSEQTAAGGLKAVLKMPGALKTDSMRSAERMSERRAEREKMAESIRQEMMGKYSDMDQNDKESSSSFTANLSGSMTGLMSETKQALKGGLTKMAKMGLPGKQGTSASESNAPEPGRGEHKSLSPDPSMPAEVSMLSASSVGDSPSKREKTGGGEGIMGMASKVGEGVKSGGNKVGAGLIMGGKMLASGLSSTTSMLSRKSGPSG